LSTRGKYNKLHTIINIMRKNQLLFLGGNLLEKRFPPNPLPKTFH
jgi:hypothetical protein